eukprot:Awhi_evm1s8565
MEFPATPHDELLRLHQQQQQLEQQLQQQNLQDRQRQLQQRHDLQLNGTPQPSSSEPPGLLQISDIRNLMLPDNGSNFASNSTTQQLREELRDQQIQQQLLQQHQYLQNRQSQMQQQVK